MCLIILIICKTMQDSKTGCHADHFRPTFDIFLIKLILFIFTFAYAFQCVLPFWVNSIYLLLLYTTTIDLSHKTALSLEIKKVTFCVGYLNQQDLNFIEWNKAEFRTTLISISCFHGKKKNFTSIPPLIQVTKQLYELKIIKFQFNI